MQEEDKVCRVACHCLGTGVKSLIGSPGYLATQTASLFSSFLLWKFSRAFGSCNPSMVQHQYNKGDPDDTIQLLSVAMEVTKDTWLLQFINGPASVCWGVPGDTTQLLSVAVEVLKDTWFLQSINGPASVYWRVPADTRAPSDRSFREVLLGEISAIGPLQRYHNCRENRRFRRLKRSATDEELGGRDGDPDSRSSPTGICFPRPVSSGFGREGRRMSSDNRSASVDRRSGLVHRASGGFGRIPAISPSHRHEEAPDPEPADVPGDVSVR
ncbi:uncharacterized protein LOC119922710 [Tachyglossus aculeatus]|uniref:uncharacterized protein LOC119922710 n=1 Tax=Tachyglossus aculeatus TaxID=9261 RepID=UPI0018F43C98|nr:uncharacterized protein LOC119922710 [Tachyglossus aculeatus]